MEIISFQKSLELANLKAKPLVKKPKLLLGNGFSLAFDKKIFNSNNYYDTAVKKGFFRKSQRLYKILKDIGVSDFEKGMRALQKCCSILAHYNSLKIPEIQGDINTLKNIFIHSIFLNHPEAPHAINIDQYQACHKFLINFESIYTLNYDLLLYWVYVKHKKILFKDGFINSLTDSQELVWCQKNEKFINLYYLHGALHLYQDGNDIKKHISKYNKITLKNQIENKLQQNKLPLFVSGGTASSKEKTIRNNPYLHSAFNSFKQCDHALFIYGFSFNDNDDHIIQAIAESNVNKLFISIYKQNMSDSDKVKINESIKRIKVLRYFSGKQQSDLEVHYYDAETANVWASPVQLKTNRLKDNMKNLLASLFNDFRGYLL